MKREWIEKLHDGLCVILNHLLFVAAAITVSDLFHADNPNFFLWMAFALLPAGVFYLTKKIPKLIPAPIDEMEEQLQGGTQADGSGMSEVVPTLPLEGLRNAIIVMLIISIIVGLCFMVYYIYLVIKDMEGPQKRKKKQEKIEANGDVREYCGVEKKNHRKAGSFFFRTNREKIRRLYQKKIIRRKNELIGDKEEQQLKYLTAKECCDKLSEQQLKLVYEKARYSPQEISAEDVRLAK